MLIASVSLWRKYHPTHKTVLYVDDMTYEIFTNLDILHLWHSVRPLIYPEKIKREIFWSGSKTKIISETEIPLLIIDHDFLIFKNIDEYLQDSILCTYDEIASNWYPLPSDKWGVNLTSPIKHIINRATNVSLFYLPDPDFARRYGKQVLKNHEEFSAMDTTGMSANHMIYSEQFMLRQWIEKERIPFRTLCKNIWDCNSIDYTVEEWSGGYWNKQEAIKGYKHYGVEKRQILDNKPGHRYSDSVAFLLRCINAGKLVNVSYLKHKLELIENR